MTANHPLISLKQAGIRLLDCDHKTPKAQHHGLPYIGIPQLKDGRITLDGARLISEDDFHYWRRKAKPTPNDVILSRRCNPGESAFVPDGLEIALGQNLVLLRSDGTRVYPPFLRWLTQGPQWWSQVSQYLNVGAVFDSLKCADIPKFEVYLPPITDQKSIAKVMGELDQKIQINHQINQTIEQMAQAIFKSWFVDFEPVKAKFAALEAGGSEEDALLAAMQTISGKDATALTHLQTKHPDQYAELRTTAALFPSAMQHSELGEIPVGWVAAPISDFGRVVCGKTPSKQKPEYYGGNIPFIKIPDMHGKMFANSTIDHLSQKGGASQSKKVVPKGSICVSCIATVGQVVITTEDSHTNQQINSIVPNEDYYTAYLYFRMKSLHEYLHDLASGGSATLNLNTGNFSRIPILMPSKEVLAEYAKYCRPLLSRVLLSMNEINVLETLRDTLLPKLLIGEITAKGKIDA